MHKSLQLGPFPKRHCLEGDFMAEHILNCINKHMLSKIVIPASVNLQENVHGQVEAIQKTTRLMLASRI
ncbi:hypothetical protein DPMN_116420 [Dreissena polymorpha]|uniref:Uncharacterized protein n=1 Tax=Dreissena polymorpha TaxID=45954 RepID=A0A9D4KNI9_DREPO|nr:hypothetical protein DPMN_116420 [Dreissena polymorpha]